MCGIAGIIGDQNAEAQQRALVERMCALQIHRGPDEGQVVSLGSAVLGHRRLSIIDLSSGQQPMSTSDGRYCIVFNGEIYNFPELRKELETKGIRFRTHSDTETLLQSYVVYGEKMLQKLNGMFAFAIWDTQEQILFAARDRLGKKPFYYANLAGTFIFASELKSLLAHPELTRDIAPEAVNAYFSFGYIPSPITIFKHVNKLRSGHSLIYKNGNIHLNCYWDVHYQVSTECKTENDYVDKLDELLTASVKRRLISEVPLGAFLSGGIDSSTVVGTMAKVSSAPVKTFTIDFTEKGYSEAEQAREISRIFNTEHHEFTVKPDAAALLDHLVWHCDEPFADSSTLPTYYVSKMAREKVTVILSGDGGDELFAGYRHYAEQEKFSAYKKIPLWLRQSLGGPLSRMLPMNAPGKYFLKALSEIEAREAGEVIEQFPPIKDLLLNREWREIHSINFDRNLSNNSSENTNSASNQKSPGHSGSSTDPLEPKDFVQYWSNRPQNPMSRRQYDDTKIYLPEDILVKVDRMSMAVSLETRAPLLDYTLVEFAASIPPELQRKDGKGKYILRKMAARLLPESILNKPKQGFAIPRDQWFKAELKDYAFDLLTSERCRKRGYTNSKMVTRILNEQLRGTRDYSLWIWSLLVFELWHRNYIDADTRKV